MKRRHRIFLIIMIVWMCGIFFYSAQDADQSTEQSTRIGMAIGHILHSDFDSWDADQQYAYAESIDHAVRKTAHATEYALLAVWVYLASGSWHKAQKIRCLMAWATASAYAVTDEIHQYFVPGRACMAKDVCIDSGGAAIGALLSLLIAYHYMKKHQQLEIE